MSSCQCQTLQSFFFFFLSSLVINIIKNSDYCSVNLHPCMTAINRASPPTWSRHIAWMKTKLILFQGTEMGESFFFPDCNYRDGRSLTEYNVAYSDCTPSLENGSFMELLIFKHLMITLVTNNYIFNYLLSNMLNVL